VAHLEGGAYARALEEARREFASGKPDVMALSAGAVFAAQDAGPSRLDSSDPAALDSTDAGRVAGSGVFRVPYLDRSLQVTYPEGRVHVVCGGLVDEATVAETVIALHYLARAAGPLDLSDPVRFQGLPGSAAYVAAFRAHAEVPLIRRFGDDGRAFVSAARALGGAPVGARGTAASGDADDDVEVMWSIPFLPCLPLGVRLGLAEDAMPGECVMVFPRRAGFVHHVEDLAVAGELLSARLLVAAEEMGAAAETGKGIAVLAVVYDPMEAEIIVAKLRSAGIHAVVRHDALSVVYGLTVNGAGKSEVLVRAGDLPEARGALGG
jgi:hypothetical protein